MELAPLPFFGFSFSILFTNRKKLIYPILSQAITLPSLPSLHHPNSAATNGGQPGQEEGGEWQVLYE
jgi:hypothetical protein